jgi:hypothetical protein
MSKFKRKSLDSPHKESLSKDLKEFSFEYEFDSDHLKKAKKINKKKKKIEDSEDSKSSDFLSPPSSSSSSSLSPSSSSQSSLTSSSQTQLFQPSSTYINKSKTFVQALNCLETLNIYFQNYNGHSTMKKAEIRAKNEKIFLVNICRDCAENYVKNNNDLPCRFIGWRKYFYLITTFCFFFVISNSIFKRIKEDEDNTISVGGFLQFNDLDDDKDNDIWRLETSLSSDEFKLKVENLLSNISNIAKTKTISKQDEKVLNHIKIISFIGDHFKDLIKTELKYINNYLPSTKCKISSFFFLFKILNIKFTLISLLKDSNICKKQIANTREYCDQCDTSIFNSHFVCLDCGFSVCLDCYNLRLNEKCITLFRDRKYQDSNKWYYCVTTTAYKNKYRYRLYGVKHNPKQLQFVQYIPSNLVESIYEKYEITIDLINRLDIKSKNAKASNELDQDILVNWSKSSNFADENEKVEGYSSFLFMKGYYNDKNLLSTRNLISETFDNEWINRRPIIITSLNFLFDQNLWSPQSFLEDFGHLTDFPLFNCRNRRYITGKDMSYFWLGFEDLTS